MLPFYSRTLLQPLICSPSLLFWFFETVINGIVQYVIFWDWFCSFETHSSCYVYPRSFLFIAEWYYIEWIQLSLLNHSPTKWHVGCFQTINIHVKVFSMNLSPHLSRVDSQKWDFWIIWWLYVELYKKLLTHFPECCGRFWTLESMLSSVQSVSCLSTGQKGLLYQAKLPFRRCYFHMGVAGGKIRKLQLGLKINVDWTNSLTSRRVGKRKRNRGRYLWRTARDLLYNLDPTQGEFGSLG